MKRAFYGALAGLVLLVGCGAESPPMAEGGIDLTEFWADDE